MYVDVYVFWTATVIHWMSNMIKEQVGLILKNYTWELCKQYRLSLINEEIKNSSVAWEIKEQVGLIVKNLLFYFDIDAGKKFGVTDFISPESWFLLVQWTWYTTALTPTPREMNWFWMNWYTTYFISLESWFLLVQQTSLLAPFGLILDELIHYCAYSNSSWDDFC